MPKFSRYDPRNKKNGRHKKMKMNDYSNAKKNTLDMEDDKYLRKYKKIEYVDDEDEMYVR